MSHPSIPPRKRQRLSRPHQVTLETDDDDNVDATPSESNAIVDDGKTIGVELRTVRVDEVFQAFSNLGKLACRNIVTLSIKSCHPKKRTRCPYRGQARTRPDYWLSSGHWEVSLGCRHIEPAHLKKCG